MREPTERHPWRGVFPYLVTPTDSLERIAEAPLRALVRRVLEAGVHGVVPLGSSGELPFLSDEARAEVIRIVVEEAGGEVPVVPGIGGFGSAHAVEQAMRAEALGADGLLCVLQGYSPLGREEILRFFSAVSDASELPIVVYHHPVFCHVKMELEVVESLAGVANVAYMKDASGSLGLFSRSDQLDQLGIRLFSATAVSPTSAMLLGGVGWMSGPACVFPEESVLHFELCRAGRWQDAVRLEKALDSVLSLFRAMGPAASVKALLRADGFDAGMPFAPIDPGLGLELEGPLKEARALLAETIRSIEPEAAAPAE